MSCEKHQYEFCGEKPPCANCDTEIYWRNYIASKIEKCNQTVKDDFGDTLIYMDTAVKIARG
jgi:hypothetical protein